MHLRGMTDRSAAGLDALGTAGDYGARVETDIR
jgi:hypothetical protein